MKKNTLSGVVLTIMLTATVCLAFNIQFVSAQEENVIYILGDGTLNPPTAPLIRDGDFYTLSEDFFGTITVWTDDIVIDGNGNALQGSGQGTGIDLTGVSNVTIQNMVIKYFSTAVYIRESSFITVFNNTITGNGGFLTPIIHEVPIGVSSNNTILQNILENNTGVAIFFCGEYSNASGNLIRNNDAIGIQLDGINSTVFGNTIVNNTATAISSSGSYGVICENNVANNTYALLISGYNDLFYLNNFVNNTNLYFGYDTSITRFDNGTHGNYWSGYDGVDVDGDGIGDLPYVIDQINQDNYPLVEKVDVIVIPEISSWILILGVFTALTITITLHNRKTGKK